MVEQNKNIVSDQVLEHNSRNKFLFVVITLLYISFGLLSSVIGVIIDKFQSTYDVSLSVAALLPFSFFLAYGLTSIPFGISMDKYGPRKVLLSGVLLMTFGSFLLYFSNNYLLVILMIFIIGVGVTAVQISGNPFIRELDAPKNYNLNLTIIIGIGSLGYAISPLLVPIVEEIGFNWNTVYLIFGILNLLIFFLLAMTRFPQMQVLEEEKINTSTLVALLQNPLILLYALGIFMYVGGEVGVSSYIITYMDVEHGVTSSTAIFSEGSFLDSAFASKTAFAVGLFWFLQMIGRLVISFLMKFFSERSLFIFHSIGTVVVLIIALVTNAEFSLIAFVLVGYFTCASFTALFSATINSFDTNHGSISGILGTAIVGGAIVGWLVGFVGQEVSMNAGMFVNILAFSYVAYLALFGKGKLDLKNE